VELLVSSSDQTTAPCCGNKFGTAAASAWEKTPPDQAKHRTQAKPEQKQTRLARVQTIELIERYQTGETVHQLGDAY